MVKQQTKSELTKNKIKEAASFLFVKQNFDETSISDITKHAGYAVGSFYKHWKRKEDLLFELWYDATTNFMLETAHTFPTIQTTYDFSVHMVERVSIYGKDPFIQNYFSAHYSLEIHDERAMSDAFDLYVTSIYQQLLTLHKKERSQHLWNRSIAVADLLNGHVLNKNNFGKNSSSILEKEQLISIVNQMIK